MTNRLLVVFLFSVFLGLVIAQAATGKKPSESNAVVTKPEASVSNVAETKPEASVGSAAVTKTEPAKQTPADLGIPIKETQPAETKPAETEAAPKTSQASGSSTLLKVPPVEVIQASPWFKPVADPSTDYVTPLGYVGRGNKLSIFNTLPVAPVQPIVPQVPMFPQGPMLPQVPAFNPVISSSQAEYLPYPDTPLVRRRRQATADPIQDLVMALFEKWYAAKFGHPYPSAPQSAGSRTASPFAWRDRPNGSLGAPQPNPARAPPPAALFKEFITSFGSFLLAQGGNTTEASALGTVFQNGATALLNSIGGSAQPPSPVRRTKPGISGAHRTQSSRARHIGSRTTPRRDPPTNTQTRTSGQAHHQGRSSSGTQSEPHQQSNGHRPPSRDPYLAPSGNQYQQQGGGEGQPPRSPRREQQQYPPSSAEPYTPPRGEPYPHSGGEAHPPRRVKPYPPSGGEVHPPPRRGEPYSHSGAEAHPPRRVETYPNAGGEAHTPPPSRGEPYPHSGAEAHHPPRRVEPYPHPGGEAHPPRRVEPYPHSGGEAQLPPAAADPYPQHGAISHPPPSGEAGGEAYPPPSRVPYRPPSRQPYRPPGRPRHMPARQSTYTGGWGSPPPYNRPPAHTVPFMDADMLADIAEAKVDAMRSGGSPSHGRRPAPDHSGVYTGQHTHSRGAALNPEAIRLQHAAAHRRLGPIRGAAHRQLHQFLRRGGSLTPHSHAAPHDPDALADALEAGLI